MNDKCIGSQTQLGPDALTPDPSHQTTQREKWFNDVGASYHKSAGRAVALAITMTAQNPSPTRARTPLAEGATIYARTPLVSMA